MPVEPSSAEPHWKAWGWSDWNERLFSYCFSISEGNVAPVTRLVMTSEELRSVVSDANASRREVHAAFRNAIRSRLHQVRRSLCADAVALEWQNAKATFPAYFAHLVLTCLAASESGDEETTDGNFRVRLNQLLGRRKDRIDYPLAKLPQLWKMLQAWLQRARERGEPFRELILRRPRHLKIIGYSIELAFPSRKDRLELTRAFSGSGFSVPLPVLSILSLIEQRKAKFSERFREAYEDFRQAFLAKKKNLYRLPFWSAVEEAASRPAPPAGHLTETAPHALLVLEREWGFELNVFIDSPSLAKLPPGICIEHAGEFAIDGYEYLLLNNEDDPKEPSAAHLLLGAQLEAEVPELRANDIQRAVEQGVLLFFQHEQGSWLLALSRPSNGELLALVRSHVATPYLAGLSQAGAESKATASSRYRGWTEVSGFSAQHLVHPAFASSALNGINCLQGTIAAPKLVLRDGIKGENSWLGYRVCLPRVQIEGADNVTLGAIGAEDAFDPDSTVGLVRDNQAGDIWHIPAPPLLPEDLQGRFLLRAFSGSTLLGTRRVEFSTQVLGHDFATPKDRSAWFSEGGQVDVEQLGPNGGGPSEITADTEPDPFIERIGLVSHSGSPVPSAKGVETLTELLAAISLSRAKLTERELLYWTRTSLGIDGTLLWDVLRAWVEAGLIDCYIYRRWRMKAYYARRPRFVAFRRRGAGTLRAVLQGLSTIATIRELERLAAEEGATIITKRPCSPWLPALFALDVPNMQSLQRLSAAATLIDPQWLQPIESCCSPLDVVRSEERQRLRNHVHVGTWNWDANRFDSNSNQVKAPVSLEWYRRQDAPDAFSVVCSSRPPWTTLSRTWAFLVAECAKGTRPYRVNGETALKRVTRSSCHLPLPVGRFSAIVSGVAPGPIPDETAGTWEYRYTFNDCVSRERALSALWPTAASKDQIHRARWLATLMRMPPAGDCRLVTLSDNIRRALISKLPRAEAEPFVRPCRVPGFLLAHLSSLAKALRSRAE